MTVEQALTKIRAIADPRAVKVWARAGMPTEKYLGAGLSKLKALAKTIKKDHALALGLWATGIHDARLLATMVADPKLADAALCRRWMADVTFWDLADKLAQNVVAKTPHARALVEEWLKSDREWVKRGAFATIAAAAASADEAQLQAWLGAIRRGLDDAQNFVRDGANNALIYVGRAGKPKAHAAALALARAHGPVEVDYGESSCQVPDAVKILGGAAARRRA
ncbi:MAG TPA: DNA alkylation repair protein [Polyangia bacterium]|nr:DNA alkylation repair protein [Polyangia bacterium]